MTLVPLLSFAVVPFAAWWYARGHAPQAIWLATGAAFGMVVSPLSLGLYSTYFLSPLGLPTGMVGLVSTLFHGPPGFHMARWLGLLPSQEVVSGVGHIYVEVQNGLFWAEVYGSLGFGIDRVRIARSRKTA